MKTIILTGGGTGGHIIPHLAILPILRKNFDKIYYFGTNGLEKELLKRESDVIFVEITAHKLNRKNILKNFALPFKLLKSIKDIKRKMREINPDVIFSKGGFVSVPVCLAGKSLGVPIVSHESDLTLGKANKLIYKLCTKFCTTFEKTAENLKKGVCTGSPIRNSLFTGNKAKGYKLCNFTESRPTVLFTGGSTGAQALNDVVFSSLPVLTKKYNVIHLVGKNKGDKKYANTKNYCQMEFCPDIEHLFAVSDVVVSRAGSNAIFELLALNKKMILVPLPKGTSRGDQVENAKYFKEKNYAEVIFQEDLTPETLITALDNAQKKSRALVAPENINGTENIVKVILSVCR